MGLCSYSRGFTKDSVQGTGPGVGWTRDGNQMWTTLRRWSAKVPHLLPGQRSCLDAWPGAGCSLSPPFQGRGDKLLIGVWGQCCT
jgi:hypothetical protein